MAAPGFPLLLQDGVGFEPFLQKNPHRLSLLLGRVNQDPQIGQLPILVQERLFRDSLGLQKSGLRCLGLLKAEQPQVRRGDKRKQGRKGGGGRGERGAYSRKKGRAGKRGLLGGACVARILMIKYRLGRVKFIHSKPVLRPSKRIFHIAELLLLVGQLPPQRRCALALDSQSKFLWHAQGGISQKGISFCFSRVEIDELID